MKTIYIFLFLIIILISSVYASSSITSYLVSRPVYNDNLAFTYLVSTPYIMMNMSEGGVVTAPSTDFTIWDGNSWEDSDVSEYIEFVCGETETSCEPTNQNAGSSQSIYKICNNGTADGTNVYMNIDAPVSNINLKCDDDYTSSGATTLTASNQSIHGALVIDACIFTSCWADYSNPTSGGYFDVFAHVE